MGYDWVVLIRSLNSGCSLQLRQVCTAECEAFESSASDITHVERVYVLRTMREPCDNFNSVAGCFYVLAIPQKQDRAVDVDRTLIRPDNFIPDKVLCPLLSCDRWVTRFI
jgi:hypothetical protein